VEQKKNLGVDREVWGGMLEGELVKDRGVRLVREGGWDPSRASAEGDCVLSSTAG